MKKLGAFLLFVMMCGVANAQQNLLSYEDITYIITNNLQVSDDFMQSKGYEPAKKKPKPGNRSYTIKLGGGGESEVLIRHDGKRVYIYLTTNEPQQYNVLATSIAPYVISKETSGDLLTYHVKNLGDIYVLSNEALPYDPLKRDYDIRIVSDKNITAIN